jgi:OmpA-OmpF porin, OOP family
MRAILTTAALLAIGASGSLMVPAARAADNPNAAQIIQQLTPTPGGEMRTRGIRMGGEASKSSGESGHESIRAAKAPESNLNVPFASGSAEISPAAASVLDQLGQALTSPNLSGFKFRVEGHTDTTGAADMNKALSEQRAMAVADYLATKFNIDRARLMPVGMGEDGLLVETGPGVANAANRRVLVVNLGS